MPILKLWELVIAARRNEIVMHLIVAGVCAGLAEMSILMQTAAAESQLPKGLVYLSKIDPSIQQDMRYATSHNYLGRPLPGYESGDCILQERVARALSNAQTKLASRGLSLRVLDCYRPKRAVEALVNRARSDQGTGFFNPNIIGNQLVKSGYIASTSKHSTGNAVDITLAKTNLVEFDKATASLKDCRHPDAEEKSGELDMGTTFDCFDSLSFVGTKDISSKQAANRRVLSESMAMVGMSPYRREWWHFSMSHPGSSYDIPVKAE